MNIAMIAAMANHRVIGKNNSLPWHLPADLKHFKALTMGKAILMGRKTYESIGKPLPGRQNIILTHDRDFHAPGCLIIHSIEAVLSQTLNEPALSRTIANKTLPQASAEATFSQSSVDAVLSSSVSNELMVIGGAHIYQLFLPLAQTLYLTLIHADIPGDTYFPEWQAEEWTEISREDHVADEQSKFDYSFLTMER